MPPHEAIRHLLYRYCELMDAGDFSGLARLFADATLTDESGTEFARGTDAVLAFYKRGTRMYDGSPRTRHLTSNSIIDVDEMGGTAAARSSYVVFQGTEGLSLQPIVTGRYRDRFAVGTDDSWYFTERRFYVDQTGDLSHHLTYDL